MAENQPPRRGDRVAWRGQTYLVQAVFKSSVHLIGDSHTIKVRCLKPVAKGGFDEAAVVQRATR